MSSTSFLKKVRNGLGSILFGVLIAGILGEIVVRVFGLGTTQTLEYYKGHVPRYRPGATFTNHKERTQEVEANSLGYYDREREKTNSNYRIAIFGDSFLEGKQVPKDSLFHNVLEDKLHRAGCTNLELVSGGMAGMGTAAEYVIWRDYFQPEIKHDAVIVQIYMGNDLSNNSRELSKPVANKSIFCDSIGAISIENRPDGFGKRSLKWFRNYSALVNLVYERLSLLKRGKTNEDVRAENAGELNTQLKKGPDPVKNPIAWRQTVNGTLAVLKNWNAELRQMGKPFFVVIINKSQPWANNDFELDFMKRVQEEGVQNGYSVLIPDFGQDPFKHYSWDGKLLGHFNFEGHRETGNQMFQWLYPQLKEECKPEAMAQR